MKRWPCVVLIVVLSTTSISGADPKPVQGWAETLFDKLELDLGTVPRGLHYVPVVTVTNVLKIPVHILDVSETALIYQKQPAKKWLQPGESVGIELQPKTRHFHGRREGRISIRFDQPEFADVRISIKADIRSDLAVSPGQIEFGKIKHGEVVTKTVTIKSLGVADWKIMQIGSDEKSIDASYKEIRRQTNRDGKPDIEYELAATLRPTAPAGKVNAKITVELNDAMMPFFDVIATGEIHDAAADNGLDKLFGKRERNKAGEWQVLDQPSPAIVDADLKLLEPLTQLESLNLAFAKKVTDEGLVHLKPLAELRRLNLGGCRLVTDAGLKNLSSQKSLEMLNLSLTQVSDKGTELLSEFANLQHLDLDNTSVTDEGLPAVARLKKLEYLRLADLPLSDQGLKCLTSLEKLRALVLDGVSMTDAGLDTLSSLKGLTRVSLKKTRVSPAGVERLRQKKPKLQVTYDESN